MIANTSPLGLGINLEIGPLLFVALERPVAFMLRRGTIDQCAIDQCAIDQRGTLIGGSRLVVLVAGIWLAQVGLEFRNLPI